MGQEFLEDDERPGRPVEVITEDKVALVEKLVLSDRRFKTKEVAEIIKISGTTVRRILHGHLGMQKRQDTVSDLDWKAFRSSIALGYVPASWKAARVVFIPKTGRIGYSLANSYRPISLTSFLMKALKKIVDRYLIEEVLSTSTDRSSPLGQVVSININNIMSWHDHVVTIAKTASQKLGSCSVVTVTAALQGVDPTSCIKTEARRAKLNKVKRLACLSITSAVRTTPLSAIETLLNLSPLDLAEVYAILACANRIREIDGSRGRITICSDSQGLVLECRRALDDISAKHKLSLMMGSGSSFVGPEPALGLSANLIRKTTGELIQNQYSLRLNSISGHLRQARELLAGPAERIGRFCLFLDRSNLRLLVSLLTGHNSFRRHLFVMRVVNGSTCTWCGEDEESSAHILCRCHSRLFGDKPHKSATLRSRRLRLNDPAAYRLLQRSAFLRNRSVALQQLFPESYGLHRSCCVSLGHWIIAGTRTANADIKKVVEWGLLIKVQLNLRKTQATTLTKKSFVGLPTVEMEGLPTVESTSVKLLGIDVNNNISWHDHVVT
nr:unnamed protein product [Callosobruchus analis]